MSGPQGRRDRSSHIGFTLVELLVVIAILAISVGLITVNLAGGQAGQLEDDARRLSLLIQHARDDAVVGGQPVALTAGAEGFLLSRREHMQGWVPFLDVPMRASGAVAARSRLRVAGVEMPPGEPLVFGPSGLALPYELTLVASGWRVSLNGDATGRVRVTRAFRDDAAP